MRLESSSLQIHSFDKEKEAAPDLESWVHLYQTTMLSIAFGIVKDYQLAQDCVQEKLRLPIILHYYHDSSISNLAVSNGVSKKKIQNDEKNKSFHGALAVCALFSISATSFANSTFVHVITQFTHVSFLYHNTPKDVVIDGSVIQDLLENVHLNGTDAKYVSSENANHSWDSYLVWKRDGWTIILNSHNGSKDTVVSIADKVNMQLRQITSNHVE